MSQLVRKAQRGDKDAFITLMEGQKQTMHKVAVGILKNDADAAGKTDTINEDFLRMLEQLEERYRVVLLLYYVEEFSIKEISSILKTNENTIKTRLARGRGIFKKVYMKEYGEMDCRTSEI